MAAPKHDRVERERHLATVASLYTRERTQQQIADATGVARSQIAYDLKQLVKRWRESGLFDVNAAVGRQLAKLDTMESELWDAWESSKQPKEETQTRKVEDSPVVAVADKTAPQRGSVRSSASVKKTQRDPDGGYMALILSVVQERSKLLGLYPAEKRDILVQTGIPVAWLQELPPSDDDNMIDVPVQAVGTG